MNNAGWEGFWGNFQEMLDSVTEEDEDIEFITAWHKTYGLNEVTAQKLIPSYIIATEKTDVQSRYVGRVIKTLLDKMFNLEGVGTVKVIKTDKKSQNKTWFRLKKV